MKTYSLDDIQILKAEHTSAHESLLSEINQIKQDPKVRLPPHILGNIFNAHSSYTVVLDRVEDNLCNDTACNPTDLELIEIRSVHYTRQVADFFRYSKPSPLS